MPVTTIPDWEPTDDEIDAVRKITLLLAKIPEQLEAYSAIEPVRPRTASALAADDILLEPFPASQLVTTCLASAADCLNAIDVLMRDGDDQYLWAFAQYPLLRSALEASSQALWLLGPEDRRERIVRNLRVRATEIKQDALVFAQTFAESPANLLVQKRAAKTQKSEMTQIAESLGIKRAEYEKKQLSYAEIVREGSQTTGSDGTREETVWRLISGFTHPYSSRSRIFSRAHPLLQNGEATGMSALSANPTIVLVALTTAQLAFTAAVELTITRSSS
jgi:hypothetical protein